ncbi:MAG: flavin monoamine oxidase family protein, partial [Bdellovibrionota bacterium]
METDVIILGAGLAGITAAADLTTAGLRVQLLEARDRIGGRVHSVSDPNFPGPLDLGAEFIHGLVSETWKVISRNGLPAYDVPDRHHWAQAGRIAEQPDFWNRIEKVFKKMRRYGGAGERVPDRSPDRSFDEFSASMAGWSGPEERRLARLFVEGFHAADPAVISERALASEEIGSEEIDGTQAYRIDGGMALLTNAIYAGIRENMFDLKLETRAESLRWDHGAVEVLARTSGGEQKAFRAKRLLTTLPPKPFLALAFHPVLFRKREAYSLIRNGAVSKIFVRFKEAFWEGQIRRLSFLHSEEKFFPTWWTTSPFHFPVLTGWTGGPAALELSAMGGERIQTHALTTLGKLFRLGQSDLRRMILGTRVVDWESDPLAQGAYSYLPVGGIRIPEEAAAP